MRYTHSPQSIQSNLKFHAQAVSRLASILVFALLVFALAITGTAAAQVAPQVGPYGFVLNATFSDPSTHGGAGLLGVMNFDGAGNVSGPYALELGSGGANPQQSITGQFTGTYYANADGVTWTVSIDLDAGVNLTLTTVLNNRGRGLELALTGCTGPICDLTGTVVSGVGRAEFNGAAHPIHQGFLTGSYGLQSTKSSPTPQTSVEVWTFGGAGNVTLSGTVVEPGLVAGSDYPGPARQGTYTVNLNGTGTITIPPKVPGGNAHTYAFVITSGHSGLLVLQTHRAGDGVEYLTGQRQ